MTFIGPPASASVHPQRREKSRSVTECRTSGLRVSRELPGPCCAAGRGRGSKARPWFFRRSPAGEIVEHAGDSLPGRTDAAGDVAVNGHRLDPCGPPIDDVDPGLAQQFGVHPVVGGEGTQVHDPLVGGPDDLRQPHHHLQGDVRMLRQQVQKQAARQCEDQRILQGHDAGRPRLAVEGRELTEVVALGNLVEGDLASEDRIVDHPDAAADNEEHVRGRAVAVDDLLLRGKPLVAAGLLDGGQPLRAELAEKANT